MIDTDRDMGTACDCPNNNGMNCVHHLVIERYHQQFEEPVLDGEEPNAFLIYSNYKGLLHLFSIGTACGSTRHHSHKRTIVTCNLVAQWNCKLCPKKM